MTTAPASHARGFAYEPEGPGVSFAGPLSDATRQARGATRRQASGATRRRCQRSASKIAIDSPEISRVVRDASRKPVRTSSAATSSRRSSVNAREDRSKRLAPAHRRRSASTKRPPGRSTRRISASPRSAEGQNGSELMLHARSKLPSARGRRSRPQVDPFRSPCAARATRRLACMTVDASMPTTLPRGTRAASSSIASPGPNPISST